MDRGSKELIALFIILSVIATTASYWRYVVMHDYEIFYDEELFNQSLVELEEET